MLGTTPFAGACASHGLRGGSTAHDVDFSVPRADLYIADPNLAIREHMAWRAVCQVSGRERCVEEQTRALAEYGIKLERRR